MSDVGNPILLWQLLALGLCLGAAWVLALLVNRRLLTSGLAARFDMGGVKRVAFPLTALLLVIVGKAIIRHWHPPHLLNIAVPLLVSLAIIRLAVYMMRFIFAPSSWLQTSERLLAALVWIGVALHITGFLPDILHLLDELSFNVGAQRVSALLILQGLISIAVTFLAALWLGRLMENPIMHAEALDMNLRVVLAKSVRAALIVVGIMIALPAAGIDITVLSVFGGALGVGLGFGLQKIASNYVSGFIILLDKSIHLDDVITVDNRYGAVSRLTGRYTVIKGLDGTESIIPNETLITSTVINHSYSDRNVRVKIPVQVSYQSPLESAMGIMLQAALHHSRVLREPPPRVYLAEFADSGINLEMSVWISDPEEGQMSLRSEINLEIWREFQKQGIEIPYPQRDVRILAAPAAPQQGS
jgi:small-conductance mechanosensitive channel